MASGTEQAEIAFARTFLNTISTQPVAFSNDYQQPPAQSLRRVPVLQIPVPPPPERKSESGVPGPSSAPISLVIKSLKPAASYTITVQDTDTISSIKEQLVLHHPTAPPVEAQRLLLKGKALADGKLLKEYTIKDGDTVNLMLKPGHSWDPNAPPKPTTTSGTTTTTSTTTTTNNEMSSSDSSKPGPFGFAPGTLDAGNTKPSRGKHQRIPSVVLSPSPPSDSLGLVEKDIMLTVDSLPSPSGSEKLSTYHEVLCQPEFWERLHVFLQKEFTSDGDVHEAFEDFLCAAKGGLTASEIARIRDQVGIIGMAGR